MPGTIDLADVTQDALWKASTLTPDPETRPGETPAFVGLSPFNVPQRIQIGPAPDGEHYVLRMSYADEEPAEAEWRTPPMTDGIALKLGQHTKKIIEIRIDDLFAFLVKGNGRLPFAAIGDMAMPFPSRLQKVLTRNAVFISDLLGKIPESVRSKIHQDVSRLQRQMKGK
jgi:hypothetical protein